MAKSRSDGWGLIWFCVVVAFTGVMLAGCSSGAGTEGLTAGAASETASPVKIGGIFGLSGYSAEWGNADLQGATLAIEEQNAKGGINGRSITFVVEDDKSDLSSTTTAVTKLAEVDGVNVIIGPTWGEFAAVAIPFAEKEDLVLVSPSGGGKDKVFASRNFFSLWPEGGFEIERLVRFLIRKNLTRIVIVDSQNSWSQDVASMFEKEAASKGLTILQVFETQQGQADFRAEILKIKALRPDAAFIPFGSESDKGLFLKQAHELNLSTRFVALVSTQSDELLTAFAPHGEGILFTYPKETPMQPEFERRFEARFGRRPQSPNAKNAYDAATAVIHALRKDPASTEELINALLETDFEGAMGHIQFDKTGKLKDMSFAMRTLRDGKFIELPEAES